MMSGRLGSRRDSSREVAGTRGEELLSSAIDVSRFWLLSLVDDDDDFLFIISSGKFLSSLRCNEFILSSRNVDVSVLCLCVVILGLLLARRELYFVLGFCETLSFPFLVTI